MADKTKNYRQQTMKKIRKSNNDQIRDIIKAARRKSREEEIKTYGKSISHTKINDSKKIYRRNKKVDIDE